MKKNEKLLDVIGEVDDKHIPEEKDNKKKSGTMKWISAVAGVGAAAAIGIFALNFFARDEILTPPSPPDETTASVSVTDAPDVIPSGGDEMLLSLRKRETVVSEITANSVGSGGVMTDSSFTVKSKRDIPAEELSEKLRLSPAADFTLEKTAECEYILTLDLSMEKGSVMKIAAESDEGGIGDSWAFQIIDDFRIKEVYPADGATYVNEYSGIEIMFSESVDLESAKQHITITPEIKGEFSARANMLYFAPSEEMKKSATYRVTVSEGLVSQSGKALPESRSFSFTVNDETRFFVYGGISETFIAGDPVVVEMRGLDHLHTEAELYRYTSADDYMTDLAFYALNNDIELDESKVKPIFSSDGDALYSDSNNGGYKPYFVMLPDELDEGWYVAKLVVDGKTFYHFLEMNPVSVYCASLGDTAVFYVNDTDTGKPAANAEVILHTSEGDFTAAADSRGVARIATGFNTYRTDVLEIVSGKHRYIDSLSNYSVYKQTYNDKYYMHFYTDREAYQPTDTMNIWGVVSPRRKGVELPASLKLCVGTYNYGAEYPTDGIMQDIELSKDGTFSATVSFENRESGWWTTGVMLLDGDNGNAVMKYKYVSTLEYVKPTYTYTVDKPDYLIMPQRNAFDVTVTAEYFEGTPAEGLTFEPGNGLKFAGGSRVTDENGKAVMQLKTGDTDRWQPWSRYYGLSLTGVENQYTYASLNMPIFYRDVMVESEYDEDAKTYTVKTNKIDFDRIPEYLSEKHSADDPYGILRGEAYDTEITVKVERHWDERREVGEYYDFLEKKTVKKYEFDNKEEIVGKYTLRSENGVAVIDDLDLSAEGYYFINISCKDTLGQNITQDDHYFNSRNYIWQVDYRSFRFISQYYFEEDEEIPFELYEDYDTGNGELSGNVFFVSYQNDFIDTVVYDDVNFTYKADNRCTPSFNACGAYFDGRHVYPIETSNFHFTPGKREILFDISTDKEKYDAGEEVTLTVYARDTDGRPVADAPVALGVVDEAAFSARQQNVEILSDLYPSIYYREAKQTCSYVQHVINGLPGTEKGGGGDDDGVRRDFRDNPYFGEQYTDSSGKTVFTFKLGDSITEWRATVQAVKQIGERMYAGAAKYPIIATRPVFISPIMLSEYVEGDDIAVTAKCVGLRGDDLITATIKGNGKEIEKSFLPCETANFGKLEKGEYTVTFRASNGVNSDAMELPLTVTDTKQEVRVGKESALGDIYSITPERWPVRISFFDKEYLFCHEILNKLMFYYGTRLDMQLASEFAANELGWYESDYASEIASATVEGLAKPLKNSEGSLRMTALMCAAFPESVSADAVEKAFYDRMKRCDLDDLAYCYMGLAALGKPVLEDIRFVLDEYDEQLRLKDKLVLTAGLALGGDFGSAYDNYVKLTGEMKAWEQAGKLYAYLENEELTGLALLSASAMDLPAAEAIARGLAQKSPKYDSYALQLIVYIRNFVPVTNGKAAFSYMTDSGRQTVELDRYGRYTLSFDKEHFDKTDFRTENGEVLTYICYTGKLSEIDTPAEIKVSKWFSRDNSEYKVGDTVTVYLKAEAYSMVEDVVPSCARAYVRSDSTFSDIGGQRVRLYTDAGGLASYTIKLTTEGEYTVESAYACRYSGGPRWGASDPLTITVKAQ